MGKGSGKKNGSRDERASVAAAIAVPVVATVPAARPAPPEVRSPDVGGTPAHDPARPAPAGTGGTIEWVAEIATASLRAVRAVLPTNRTPLVLLGAGLLVAGAVELPVVVGAGLAYEALRRWESSTPVTGR